MKLPEAIALMLEGKVMVDEDSILWQVDDVSDHGGFVTFISYVGDDIWSEEASFPADGWREATPEELKEIGL